MKKLIILFLIIPYLGLSQKYRTVDEEGSPVLFVTIYDSQTQTGVISDNKGFFNFSSNRSVIVSSVGYIKDTVMLQSCEAICDIVLKKDIRQMDEVVVYSDKKKWNNKFTEGFYDQKRSMYVSYLNNPRGYTFLVKIDNDTERPAKLLKANFDVKNNNKTTMRVRVFSVNENGEPGRDMLIENVMIDKFNIFTDVSINLAKYNIIMPANGVFIGLDVYKISEEDIKFEIGIVPNAEAKSYRGNTFVKDTFTLSERGVYGEPAYMIANYRFSLTSAY